MKKKAMNAEEENKITNDKNKQSTEKDVPQKKEKSTIKTFHGADIIKETKAKGAIERSLSRRKQNIC